MLQNHNYVANGRKQTKTFPLCSRPVPELNWTAWGATATHNPISHNRTLGIDSLCNPTHGRQRSWTWINLKSTRQAMCASWKQNTQCCWRLQFFLLFFHYFTPHTGREIRSVCLRQGETRRLGAFGLDFFFSHQVRNLYFFQSFCVMKDFFQTSCWMVGSHLARRLKTEG